MKKIVSLFAVAAICTMILSSCNSEEGPSELDILIEQLQTTHLNTGSPEDSVENEPENPYKSITGIVTSFNETDITIKSGGDEQKFVINEETQILGGTPSILKAVTITYCEPEKKSKGIIANVITMIDSEEKSAVGMTDIPVSDSTVVESSTASLSESEIETSVESESETGTEASAEYETETTVEPITEAVIESETEPSVEPTETTVAESETDFYSDTMPNEQSTVQTETQANS